MRSLEAAGDEFCMPGIGFVSEPGEVLHICPGIDGTATCFYITQGASLHLEAVTQKEQVRLLRLFYCQDRIKLRRRFDANARPEVAFSQVRRSLAGIYGVAKPLLIVAAVFFVLIHIIAFSLNVSDGVPLSENLGRLASNAPSLLLVHLGMVAGVGLFLGPIFFVIWIFEKQRWALRFEGQDHTVIILMATGFVVLFTALALFSGRWDDYFIEIGRIAGFVGAFLWPLNLMGRYHRQQDRILDRIRFHYVIATTALMAQEAAGGLKRLESIRRLEALWRLGASAPVRFAHVAYAAVTTIAIAFAGQVLAYHLNAYPKRDALYESIAQLLDSPLALALTVGVAFLFSQVGLRHALDLSGRPWAEFYGDQLQAALKAGRGVDNAPQHEFPPLPEGVSAREIFGLNTQFTKTELRTAWLRLARELHPDRWSNSGPAVRQMKEAALKRVNAARDELAPEAL
jgi:hypothetical protein